MTVVVIAERKKAGVVVDESLKELDLFGKLAQKRRKKVTYSPKLSSVFNDTKM